MILRHFRKIIGFIKKDKTSNKPNKIENAVNFLSDKAKVLVSESKVIVEKLHDLHQTNYDLGMVQLEKGNLNEAIFRFKIVRKFWPQNYDAQLKLIYCYYANNDIIRGDEAAYVLLEFDNSYQSQIEQIKIDASFFGQSFSQPVIASNENLVSDNTANNKVMDL